MALRLLARLLASSYEESSCMIANTPAELPRMPMEPIRSADGREDSAYNARMTE